MPQSPPGPPAAQPAAGAPGPAPKLPPWRPTTAANKLALLLLTVDTVLGLAYVLQRPHQLLLAAKAAQQQAACSGDAASRPTGCAGARMPVLLLPAAPPAASASPAIP